MIKAIGNYGVSTTEAIEIFDSLGHAIAAWGTPSQINTRVSTYVDFGPPGMPDAPIGILYFDKHTNKMWMLNSEKRWVQMAHYEEYKSTAAKDNKNIINCRNCGAPVKLCICEYCGTRY